MPDLSPPRSDTVFGLDFGLRRLGIAIGSSITGTANPLTTITVRDDGPDWAELRRVVEEWRPSRLVLGLPYNLDGSEHALKPRIDAFARELEARFGLPVELVDERLTSREAEARLREARASGLRKRRVDKEAVDAMAAAVILERFLDDQARDGGDG